MISQTIFVTETNNLLTPIPITGTTKDENGGRLTALIDMLIFYFHIKLFSFLRSYERKRHERPIIRAHTY
jgi:hypothetical protein